MSSVSGTDFDLSLSDFSASLSQDDELVIDASKFRHVPFVSKETWIFFLPAVFKTHQQRHLH